MKPLVIYHADCTDGFGAAFAAWLKLGDTAEYMSMAYGSIPEVQDLRDLVDGREIYLLDFSLPRVGMEELFSSASRVVWLDHHKTAFEMWCGSVPESGLWKEHDGKHFITLDNARSGALLAWNFFNFTDTTIPKLIEHIDDRDRWQFKMEGSKELHAALQSMKPWSFEQWRIWLNAVVDGNALVGKEYAPSGYLFEEGSAILRAQDKNVTWMAKQARKCAVRFVRMLAEDDDGFLWNGLAVNANLHQSELGHVLATQSGTYGLVWYVAANGKVNCSLRSEGDYDVSAIAKAFGGGGHKNAAGFETDINTLMGWLK